MTVRPVCPLCDGTGPPTHAAGCPYAARVVERYRCDLCWETFDTPADLLAHMEAECWTLIRGSDGEHDVGVSRHWDHVSERRQEGLVARVKKDAGSKVVTLILEEGCRGVLPSEPLSTPPTARTKGSDG